MKRNFLLITLVCLTLFVILGSFLPHRQKGLVEDVLSYTNDFRKTKGLPALEIRDDLNTIARGHSADMASGRVGFGHSGFEQRQQAAKSKIKTLHAFAENVAYGARSGEEVVSLWKNSTGHRRNMLGNYKYIGIGTATDSRGRIFYTQVFAN